MRNNVAVPTSQRAVVSLSKNEYTRFVVVLESDATDLASFAEVMMMMMMMFMLMIDRNAVRAQFPDKASLL